MKKVTMMFIFAFSVICTSSTHAQADCMKDCDQNQKQCLAKHSKADWWGNKIINSDDEKSCKDSAQECRKTCVKASMAK